MKLLTIVIVIVFGTYLWLDHEPVKMINREYCLRYAEENVDWRHVSTLKVRDREQQDLLYEDCIEEHRRTPAFAMIRKFFE